MMGWLLLNDAPMVGYAGGLVDRYFNGLLVPSETFLLPDVTSPDANGCPPFFELSSRDGSKVKIAPAS